MAVNNAINNRGMINIFDVYNQYGINIMSNTIQGIPFGNGTAINLLSTNTNKITTTCSANPKILVKAFDNVNTAHCSMIVKATDTDTSNAYYELSTTTNTWTFGSAPITAASTKMVLSPSATFNTDNVMEIQETGEVNFPLQPAFSARTNADVTNVTGNSTAYTVIFNTERYDIGSDFNVATGIHTAGVTGKFHYVSNVCLRSFTAATAGNLRLVTSNRTFYCNQMNPLVVMTSGQLTSWFVDVLTDMDSGDTAYMVIVVVGEASNICDLVGNATKAYSYFTGELIC